MKSFSLAVFTIDLEEYVAYDRDRLPFRTHVVAFFRISNTNLAATRIASEEELEKQLIAIVKGAIRAVTSTRILNEIMESRSELAEAFTKEVRDNLPEWGVEVVRNVEFMSIHDAEDSNVIENIMAKKKSHIEMESRTEVANNTRAAGPRSERCSRRSPTPTPGRRP